MEINLSNDKELLNVLWKATDGLTLVSNDRTKLGAGCLQLAQDHHVSILLLIEKSYYSSAFALLRVQFDSFLRGVWILRLASDKKINDYNKNRLDIKMNEMIKMVSSLPDYENTEFESMSKSLKAMNSYTHSGYSANLNHQDNGFIQQNHKKEDILNILKHASYFGSLASIEILQLAQDEISSSDLDLISSALNKYLKHFRLRAQPNLQ
ncbi:hypothetical protein [Methylotenera sp.]|uniref:DUF6988 family protein n=1 Tax=Methylotenera sp. TaxID=2051956 RepID=UPI0024886B55|nr:hypothetical protein [Methylotenera sp.]MDI1298803.1 hypothetical protein [Methylotenera sp.]